MKDDFYIYPAVKKAASYIASACGWILIICCVLSVLEIALAMGGLLGAAIAFGAVSQLLFFVQLSMLGLLTLWCHTVLLGDRGTAISHFLCLLSIPFILLLPITQVYALVTHESLITNQEIYPFIICLILLLTALLNIPKMAAAPLLLKLRIVFFPFFLLGIAVTDFPGLLPIALAFKLGAAALAAGPLFQLANLAPRLVSMPEKPQKPRPPSVNE